MQLLSSSLILLVILQLIFEIQGEWLTIVQQFQSDDFTITKSSLQNDNWILIPFPKYNASDLPDNLYTDCGQQQGHRLFGGYNVFMGCNEKLGKSCGQRYQIQKKISNVAPHYQIRISFEFFKIDFWDNQYAYVLLNNNETNTTQYQELQINQFGRCGDVDICGAQIKPLNISAIPSLNDEILIFNQTKPHNLSSIDMIIYANITDPGFSSWGIRNLEIALNLCDPTCKQCSGPGNDSCTGCFTDSNLPTNKTEGNCTCQNPPFMCPWNPCFPSYQLCKKCFDSCGSSPDGQGSFQDNATSSCILCGKGCKTCQNATACDECLPGYMLNNTPGPNGEIVCTQCPSGSFQPNMMEPNCSSCSQMCLKCNNENLLQYQKDMNLSNCTQCQPGFVQYNVTSLAVYMCRPCGGNCLQCDPYNNAKCYQCTPGYFLNQNLCVMRCPQNMQGSTLKWQCLASCEDGYYSDPFTGACQTCHPDAVKCFGPFDNNALECKKGLFYFGPSQTCSATCPIGYQPIDTTKSCNEKYKPPGSTCMVSCPPGEYFDEALWSCQKCSDNCGFCPIQSQSIPMLCISCQSPFFLQSSACLSTCYSSYFPNELTRTCTSKSQDPSTLSNVFLNLTTSVYQMCHKSCSNISSCTDSSPCCNKLATPAQFYSSLSQKCEECHGSCLTCLGTGTFCTSCNNSTSMNLNRATNYSTYFDDANLITKNQQDFLKNYSNTCPCDPKYGEVMIVNNSIFSLTCMLCHVQCLNCMVTPAPDLQTNYTMCTACEFPRVIQFNGSMGRCLCAPGYYSAPENDTTEVECFKCPYNCKTCAMVDINSQVIGKPVYLLRCTDCYNDLVHHRQIFNNNTNFDCNCTNSYFDDGSNPACQPCHYSCDACIAPGDQNSCLTCPRNTPPVLQFDPPASHRNPNFVKNITINFLNNDTLTLLSCPCLSHFFDERQTVCPPCHFTCNECSLLYTRCISCEQGTFRYLDKTTNTCPCQEGYFAPQQISSSNSTNNVNSNVCLACHFSCSLCNSPQHDDCESCPEEEYTHRYTDDTSQPGRILCPCSEGFYEYSSQLGLPYDNYADPILAMGNPNYNLSNETFVQLLKRCQPCHFSCKSCQGPSDMNCTACETTWNRQEQFMLQMAVGRCSCITPPYEELEYPVCGKCVFACEDNCEKGQPKNCTLCPDFELRHRLNFSKINGTCPCQSGYRDVGQAFCQQCHYSCETCSGSTDRDCLTCPQNSSRIFSTQNNACPCLPGYEDYGEKTLCVRCHYSCTKCPEDNLNQCLECPDSTQTFRVDNSQLNLECPCMEGYFDDGYNTTCVQCVQPCAKCYNLSACLTCGSPYFLQNNRCVTQCYSNIAQYIDTQIRECGNCHTTCFNCSGPSSSQCLSCYPHFKFFKGQCLVCEESEHKVIDPNTGMCVCDSAKSRIPVLKQLNSTNNIIICICNQLTYKTFDDRCERCSPICLTCNGKSDNCTSCEIWRNLTLNDRGQCVCKAQNFQLIGYPTNQNFSCIFTMLKAFLIQEKDTQGINYPRVRLTFSNPVNLKPDELIRLLIFEIDGIKAHQYKYIITALPVSVQNRRIMNSQKKKKQEQGSSDYFVKHDLKKNFKKISQNEGDINSPGEQEELLIDPSMTDSVQSVNSLSEYSQRQLQTQNLSQSFIIEFHPEVNFLKKRKLSIRWKDTSDIRDSNGLPLNQESASGVDCSIGPYLIMDKQSFQYQQISDLISASQSLLSYFQSNSTTSDLQDNQSGGQVFFQFLRASCFFCFLFNELNFSVLLLLLTTVHPLNFYVYLQFFGAFVIWFIPEWQSLPQQSYSYRVFGTQIEAANDGLKSSIISPGITKMGLSSSLLYNAGTVVVIEAILAIFCLLFYLQYLCYSKPKNSRTFLGTITVLFNLLTRFIEVSFLIVSISILLNISVAELDGVSRASSFLISIILLIFYGVFFYNSFTGIRQFDPVSYQMLASGGGGVEAFSNPTIEIYFPYFCDIQLTVQRVYDNDERENQKIAQIRHKVLYHWFNFTKKLLCAITLSFVHDSMIQLILLIVAHALQLIYTIYVWPYNALFKNWLKIAIDLFATTIFVILLIHDRNVVSLILEDSLSLEVVDIMFSYGTALTVFFFLHFGMAFILTACEGFNNIRIFIAAIKKFKDSPICQFLAFWRNGNKDRVQLKDESEINTQFAEVELSPQKYTNYNDEKEEGKKTQIVMQKEKIFEKLNKKKETSYGETIKQIQNNVVQWQQNPIFNKEGEEQNKKN